MEMQRDSVNLNQSASAPEHQVQPPQLELDELNQFYFDILVRSKQSAGEHERILLADMAHVKSQNSPHLFAYPTAMATPELLKHLPFVHYRDLKKNGDQYRALSKESALWFRPMQAGIGSSIERKKFLAQLMDRSPEEITLGPKGCDLYVSVPVPDGAPRMVNLAELKIAQTLLMAQQGTFGEIYFQDLVSKETRESLESLWQRPSLLDPSCSIQQYLERVPNFHYHNVCEQNFLPTLTEEGEITTARMAPGGHALFGIDAIWACYKEGRRPASTRPLIGVLANGEDLSGIPDELIVGHMRAKQIPIIMVTTEKTHVDLKGGQIAIVPSNPTPFITIIEKAQAEECNQLPLFYQLGLRKQDFMAFFNTNMALFNYDVLIPKIKKLLEVLGERRLGQIIAPHLIENWKSQRDPDGAIRRYLQLEGAMGSVILNLDRFWREYFGEPCVHVINVDRFERTRFFSPIKTAFDFFMQFASDRFALNMETFQLENQTPGKLPQVTLESPYYNEVANVLEAFNGTKIRHLEELNIQGIVHLCGQTLRGCVEIINQTPHALNLNPLIKDYKLAEIANLSITIHADGTLTLKRLSN